jgi:hypothetical protein
MIDLSIIIVNYNVKEFLKNLLNSLQKAVKNLNTEIIIVDNASTDGSVEEISRVFKDVQIIANIKNLGFGKANNIALEKAKGKYILLINPDTIVREDTFSKMIEFFETNNQAGMLGCKVLNPDGSLQLPCRRSFPTPWVSFTKVAGLSSLFPNSRLFAKYNLTYLDENEVNEVDAISGAFMMLRREVYEKIGGFDPQFFMYGEDLDLCYRTQQSGYKVYYVPHTEIIHYKGESTRRSNLDETRVFYNAMSLFVKKHFSASFFVEWILQIAIILRRTVAFVNVYKLPLISAVIDFSFFVVALLLAESFYHPGTWQGFPDIVKPYVYLIPAFMQVIVSFFTGTYRKDSLSVLRLLISLFFGLLILSSATFFLKQFGYSRAVFLISYGFLVLSLSGWRIFAKLGLKVGFSELKNKNYTLIVGEMRNIEQLIDKLKTTVSHIYNIKGLIGLDQKIVGQSLGNLHFKGSIENIKKIIISEKINTVVFSSKDISYDRIFAVVSECQGLNVQFLVSGTNQDYLVGKSEITSLEEIPFTRLFYNMSSFSHKTIKLFFDLILSSLIIIFIFPFVFLFTKLSGKKSNFAKLVFEVPSVILLRKSLVGPHSVSYYQGLYLGKPGLTGLWNLENIRKDDVEEMNRVNLYYAKNMNVWLDMDIIGRTLTKYLINKEK